MPITLFEAGTRREEERRRPSVVSGVVINNCDLLRQGKVLVRIPSLGEEVWARVASSGAGSSRGIMYIPQPDDEVVVNFVNDDPNDAQIVGGSWSTRDSPPVASPTDLLVKRKIKTGLAGGLGHEVEFDDALQTITITSSTKQKIAIAPEKIEISTLGGAAKVTLNTAGTITIEAALSLELKAKGMIKLEAAKVDINGKVATSIQGKIVKIN
ncbi:MAG: phage baseplate assembly protein V [candidate division KSB1 bacterium]|nr:phage baseplate assembly protein V [candidate division KSB1 bacterium]MDZ7273984.1 phage baseplate assembly protein V [candidate division KSB1 bacterium]MDZ7286357.1 phage baseplate assembly protein V [candidate division KSB1 bacterium]MDZ7296585.1 phage baseplate assembly protein V [candidate division KSB1 bacterium]MDZ7306118.1 phage baseplate assembly protein V [candidate division KSB1 bacterium]